MTLASSPAKRRPRPWRGWDLREQPGRVPSSCWRSSGPGSLGRAEGLFSGRARVGLRNSVHLVHFTRWAASASRPGRNDWTSGLRRAPAPSSADRPGPIPPAARRAVEALRNAPRPGRLYGGVRSRTGPEPDPGPGRPRDGLALMCCRPALPDPRTDRPMGSTTGSRHRTRDTSLMNAPDRTPVPGRSPASRRVTPDPATQKITPGDRGDRGDGSERRGQPRPPRSATRTVTADSGCRSSRSSRAPRPTSPPR